MDEPEAKKIIGILMNADKGCEYCVSDLLRRFIGLYPEFEKAADEAWVATGYGSMSWKMPQK